MTDHTETTFTAPDGARADTVARVQKLLAKASDPAATPAEAEAFEAKALQLMARYEIAERELRQASPCEARWIDLAGWGNATYGVANLYHKLAAQHGVYSLWYSDSRRVRLFGTPAQLEDVEILAAHLLPQLRHDVNRDKPRSRKVYAIAWGNKVTARLKAAQAQAYAEVGTALVPTTHRAEDYARNELGIGVSAPRRLTNPDYDSATQGGRRGEQATLGQRTLHR